MSSLLVKGLGLFNDRYQFGIIFTIDLILREQYPSNFGNKEESYLLGSIFICVSIGQIIMGILGDIHGRSKMMVISCIVLIIGGILCSSIYNFNNINLLIYLLIISHCILGFGIGFEYPISVVSAYESVDVLNDQRSQLINLFFVYLLSIFGAIFGSIITYILVLCFIQNGSNDNNLEIIWRSLFIIGIIPPLCIFYWRYKYRNIEPQLYVSDKNEQNAIAQNMLSVIHDNNNSSNENVHNYNPFSFTTKLYIIYKFYFKTIIATSVSWFTLDFIVYSQLICGDMIVSSSFSNIHNISLKNMLISLSILPACLIGFYLVLKIGCRRLQIIGFILMGVIYFIIGITWNTLQKQDNNMVFVVLYSTSLIVTNISARLSTFILPAQLYPTAIRSTCYGISSSFGKLGGALGTIFYTSLYSTSYNNKATFVGFALFSFLGALVTILLIRDPQYVIKYINKNFYLNVQEIDIQKNNKSNPKFINKIAIFNRYSINNDISSIEQTLTPTTVQTGRYGTSFDTAFDDTNDYETTLDCTYSQFDD